MCGAAHCLARLAAEPSVAAEIVASGGVEVVLSLLSRAPNVRCDPDASHALLAVAVACARAPSHAARVLRAGAVDAAIDVLRGPLHNASATSAGACALLAALAAVDDVAVVQRGGAAAVVALLRPNPGTLARDMDEGARAAVAALASMTRSRAGASAVAALNAAPLLYRLRALATVADDSELSDACAAVLANLAAAVAPPLAVPPPLPPPPPPP